MPAVTSITLYIDLLFTVIYHLFTCRQRPYHDNINNWQTRIMGVAGIDMSFSSFKRMTMNVVNLLKCIHEK